MATIKGVKEIRRAIRKAPPALQEAALVEVRKSTIAMHREAREGFNTAADIAALWHGKRAMQNVKGNVRRFYRYSVSKKQLKGRVGLLSARANRLAFYLRFFNDGTIHQPARPVHDNAFSAEREIYIRNQTAALKSVLTRIFR